MVSPKTKRNIYRIIPFAIIWLAFSIVYTLLEKGILADLKYYPATGNSYNFNEIIFITPIVSLITGILIGTIEILYLNKLFIQKSFTRKIIYKSIIYLAIIFSFLVILSAISNALEPGTAFFDRQVWEKVWKFFSDFSFLSVGIYIAAIVIVSQFYIEVSDNIGHGVLTNFLTGKYHQPTEEERVFMFLDMKSSTTIAERLGHVKYFEMLREYYADLSDPVIAYSGEIYQYVGDEIIVSWTLKSGSDNSRPENDNCIRCFFAIKAAIKKQENKYNEQFGVVPEFKAAFHIGKVTTGEIGVIKKEIIFTGDTLNTTARIQGLCNEYKVDILISGELQKKLNPGRQFQIRSLGKSELRGRDERIELFTVTTS